MLREIAFWLWAIVLVGCIVGQTVWGFIPWPN